MREAMQSRYDVVVIGGGIGGLSCGALLAQAGRSVLVVEADEQPGGFARNLTEGDYDFDLALHVIMSLAPEGPFGEGMIHAVLQQLGVAAELEYVALDPFYAVQLEDERIVLPGGRDEHLAALAEIGTDDAGSVAALFDTYDRAYREILALPVSLGLCELLRMPMTTPLLFAKRNATLAQLLDAHLRDPKVRHVHTALWPYIGLPASRMAFVPFGAMMASYVAEGAFCCRDGFQKLGDALATGLTRHGGELLLGTKVSKIAVAGRHVTGVALESGQRVEASHVISAGDVRNTFHQLVDPALVPARYLRKLKRQTPSLSAGLLYLGTDLDVRGLLEAQITMVAPYPSDESYERSVRGSVGGVSITVPTFTDPQRAPPGEHTVVIAAAVPIECGERPGWDDEKIAGEMLAMAERVLPGLSSRITFASSQNERGSLRPHYLGPIYGWAVEPKQSAAYRLPHKTPFEGLWLCGHWTQPAGGIWSVVASGIQTARLVLDQNVRGGLMPPGVWEAPPTSAGQSAPPGLGSLRSRRET
jgi:prolycopene isomerase